MALRRTFVAVLATASFVVPAAPTAAGPCQEESCPPCYTEKIDALWQEHTGKGPLFMCPM